MSNPTKIKTNNNHIDFLIIGAGISGMSAALKLKERFYKHRIIILEKSIPGKKIKVSGNGRCNIGHIINDDSQVLSDYNYQKNLFSETNLVKYFDFIKNTLKIILSNEDDLLYPYSKQSITVYNSYLKALDEKRIPIETGEVIKIEKCDEGFNVQTSQKTYKTRKLIIATGSKAYYKDYKDDYLQEFLKINDIKFLDFKPGLTGYILKENVRSLFGLRLGCELSLIKDGKTLFKEIGEIQFKRDGVSGIVVMNSSNIFARLEDKKNVLLNINLIHNINDDDLERITNSLDVKIVEYLNKVNKNLSIDNLKTLTFHINDVYGFEYAQIGIGGVLLDEINEKFESKKVKNLFFIGEILDIDGKCGGYNIMNAIISAILMAESH